MNAGFFSVGTRNLLGNALVGAAYLALGIMKLLGVGGHVEAVCLLILIVLTVMSLVANTSRQREREDEMSRFHSGRASNLALWITLIALSGACVVGIYTGANIDIATACYLTIGFALTTYGASFAMLEHGLWSC